MTTQLLAVQSIGPPHYGDSQLSLELATEMATMYSTQNHWACPLPETQPPMATTNTYINFSTPAPTSSDGQLRHDSIFQHNRFSSQDDNLSLKQASQHVYADFVSTPDPISTSATLGFPPDNAYSASPIFPATTSTMHIQNAATMTPLMTRFDQHGILSLDGQPYSAESHNFSHLPISHDDQPPLKRRRNSLRSSTEARSPTESLNSVGRRRKSEYVEPGSARAIYLEKNRKAASKCRNKQKRQQDDLVELARDVERRNRLLKAEVELLKAGMRELMDVVGKHNHCPDTRLSLYVQREANRLAAGNQQTGFFPSSSKTTSSNGTFSSKSSSP